MQKTISLFTVALVVVLATLSGCKKERITKNLAGTYIVTGGQPNPPPAPTVTNLAMQINKTGKLELTVDCSGLLYGKPLEVKWDELSDETGYFYRGYDVNGDARYQLDVLFYANYPDSVFMHYTYNSGIPAVEFADYVLTGRRQK
jgi:hypothetical protein